MSELAKAQTPRNTHKRLYMHQHETVAEIREAFLAPLLNVTKVTEGWMASCPVPGHGRGRGDLGPSLSVREGDDRLLVNCFAGCPTESVVEAIGWRMADLFARSNGKVGLLNRARAWLFVFECHEKHKAAGRSGGDGDAKGVENGIRANSIIRQR